MMTHISHIPLNGIDLEHFAPEGENGDAFEPYEEGEEEDDA